MRCGTHGSTTNLWPAAVSVSTRRIWNSPTSARVAAAEQHRPCLGTQRRVAVAGDVGAAHLSCLCASGSTSIRSDASNDQHRGRHRAFRAMFRGSALPAQLPDQRRVQPAGLSRGGCSRRRPRCATRPTAWGPPSSRRPGRRRVRTPLEPLATCSSPRNRSACGSLSGPDIEGIRMAPAPGRIRVVAVTATGAGHR